MDRRDGIDGTESKRGREEIETNWVGKHLCDGPLVVSHWHTGLMEEWLKILHYWGGYVYWMVEGGLVVHTAVYTDSESWRGEMLEVKL
jgi:hypothetical protein